MATVSRAEREQRIARDDGDPEDTVYRTTTSNTNAKSYHEDPDCWRLGRVDDVTTTTREQAQRALRYPCSTCVLGGED